MGEGSGLEVMLGVMGEYIISVGVPTDPKDDDPEEEVDVTDMGVETEYPMGSLG